MPTVATPIASSRRTILTVEQPQPNHNGGQLAFGPDGYLYIGLGDGGAAGDSGPGHAPGRQRPVARHAARQDPAHRPERRAGGAPYTVPPDNPFVDTATRARRSGRTGCATRGGSRSTATTGDLWIGDVGQNEWEEIDRVAATDGRDAGQGRQLRLEPARGRPRVPRRARPTTRSPPVYEISHDTGACAVVGGYVYRGNGDPGARRRLPVHRQLRRHDPRCSSPTATAVSRCSDAGLEARAASPASARPTTARSTSSR